MTDDRRLHQHDSLLVNMYISYKRNNQGIIWQAIKLNTHMTGRCWNGIHGRSIPLARRWIDTERHIVATGFAWVQLKESAPCIVRANLHHSLAVGIFLSELQQK